MDPSASRRRLSSGSARPRAVSRRLTGVMRLAFAVDGGVGYAAATLRQGEPDAPVHVELATTGGADARAGDRTGGPGPVARSRRRGIPARRRARPGDQGACNRRTRVSARVLFHSPYEAAAWAIISARRPSAQAAQVRQAIAEQHGARFAGAGQVLAAFPQPDRLVDLPLDTPGLGGREGSSACASVAEAALRAATSTLARLHVLGPEAAYEAVQTAQRHRAVLRRACRARGGAASPTRHCLMPEPKVLQADGRAVRARRPSEARAIPARSPSSGARSAHGRLVLRAASAATARPAPIRPRSSVLTAQTGVVSDDRRRRTRAVRDE